VTVISCSQVNIFYFKIVIINKDHGSEWIRTSITLMCFFWHLALYVAHTTKYFQFMLYLPYMNFLNIQNKYFTKCTTI